MARAAPVPYRRSMPMRGMRVASIRGIDIEVHASWFLILGVITYLLAVGFFPDRYEGATATYWLMGAAAAVFVFATVLLHELAHAAVAIRRGVPVPRITVFIFGGVSHLSRQPRTAGEEFFIAAAGPAASLVLAGIIFGVAVLLRGASAPFEAMFQYVAFVNLLLAAFNLLPGFPLDGGRVLRAIAWKRTRSFRKATRIAAGTGEMLGWAVIAAGVVFLFMQEWAPGIWAVVIGWFLLSAARSEGNSIRMDTVLNRLHARDLMDRTFIEVTPGTSIQQVVDEHMIGQGERAVVVANDDSVVGIVTVSDLGRVPRAEWGATPAQRIMTPRAHVATVAADAPAADVMPLLAQRHLSHVPVIEDGRMIGIIARREFLDRLQIAEELAPEESAEHDPEPPPIRTPGGDDPNSP
ncbi:MAG: CBS domain-containing protein [Dehalococcoidia bacterium]|nr:CBS domain-containing protein [Dehalococcoidia bacterium]MYA53645.1 CBS domain-containing protein [Dehalococcoidia bacterium]